MAVYRETPTSPARFAAQVTPPLLEPRPRLKLTVPPEQIVFREA